MPSETSSWTMLIKTYSELPEIFKDAYDRIVKVYEPFPYTIYAPSDNWASKETIPKMLCMQDSKVTYMEIKKNKVTTASFELTGIYYIESGSLLLYSWIKIVGSSNNSNITTVIVEYNTVMNYIFKYLIDNIRMKICNIQSSDFNSELYKFDFLAASNFKFMNYGRRCVLSQEKIYSIVYQPEMYKNYLKFFKKNITEAHLDIFTDKELIFISDEENKKSFKQPKYGAIQTFIPTEKIKNFTLKALENNKDYMIFKIHFSEFMSLNFIYQISKLEEMNKVVETFYKT